MKTTLLLLVLSLVVSVYADGEDWNSIKGLKHLSESSFAEYVDDNAAVIVLFHESGNASEQAKKAFGKAATTRGVSKAYKAVFAEVDCEAHGKLCNQHGASQRPVIKLFVNGAFTADFVRDVTSIALLKFAKEPTAAGAGEGVNEFFDGESKVNVLSSKTFASFLTQHDKAFVMFYAPWCGHCKSSKPELIKVAQAWNDGGIGAVDCDVHRALCNRHKVKGFPTFLYFGKGGSGEGRVFNGDRTEAAIIAFLNDPDAAPPKPEQQPFLDAEHAADDLTAPPLLGDDDFESFTKANKHVLVMFYAPWCGHCKHAKPDYSRAAAEVNAVAGGARMAAVDCTVHAKTCSAHGVSGYPTIKLFNNGKFAKDFEGARNKDGFVSFLKAPDAKAEAKSFLDDGSDSSAVTILSTKEDFNKFVGQNSHVLVMFYAPWCGHCKHAKPGYVEAAAQLNAAGGAQGALAAVDCTTSNSVCAQFDVKGYPTLKLFVDGKMAKDYEGGRDKAGFVSFMQTNTKGAKKKATVSLDDLDPHDEL